MSDGPNAIGGYEPTNVYQMASAIPGNAPWTSGASSFPVPAAYGEMFPGTNTNGFSSDPFNSFSMMPIASLASNGAGLDSNPYLLPGATMISPASTAAAESMVSVPGLFAQPDVVLPSGETIGPQDIYFPTGTVDTAGNPVLFNMVNYTLYGGMLPGNSEFPQLPAPLDPNHDSHIDYNQQTGVATYTFKPGDNPHLAAKDILASFPSDPKVPFNVMWRAVMLTLDSPDRRMKSDADARTIPVNTKISVNEVLFEAGLLMQGYGWDTKMAESISPLPEDKLVVEKDEEEKSPKV